MRERLAPWPEGMKDEEHPEIDLTQVGRGEPETDDTPPGAEVDEQFKGGLVGLDFGPPLERGSLLPPHLRPKPRGSLIPPRTLENWDID